MRRALASENIVHVATYGVLNSQSPMFSRLELARRGNGHSADDGRLEVHEVLGLPIRSSLVYLSGCETALGRSWSTDFAEGQDYATLSQAFLYAGAANVIATLWRVEDEGAGVFARTFYRELRLSPPEEALARTQRALIADEQFASPYYWAAYRLSGSALWPGRSDGRVTLVP